MPRKNKIIIRTGTTVPVATDFVTGEPAFNSSAGTLYVKNAAGTMAQIGSGVFSSGVQATGGRSLFRAVNEPYAVGSAYSATSGFVYFGARNESATPDAVISNAGGSSLMTLQNSGNVGIGVTPATGKGILQLSGGIGFPATADLSTDANTLDDYEEGNWTPTFSAVTTAPTVAYNSDPFSGRIGRYVKIGRVIHIWGRVRLTSRTGGSGSVIISGLPFVPWAGPGNAVNSASLYIGFMGNWTTNGPTGGYFPFGGSYINLTYSTAVSTPLVPIANASATAEVMFSGTYETEQ